MKKQLLLSKMLGIALILGSLGLVLTSGGISRPADNRIVWLSIDEAEERSKLEPRKIFVDVFTTWCGPCKLMDRTTFQDEKVTQYVDANYYAVKLNAESDRLVKFRGETTSEKELARSFQVQGYPTILLMDAEMGSVESRLGYIKPGPFRKLLEEYNLSN